MFPSTPLEALRAQTTRTLQAQRKRLVRRIDAIRADMKRADDAQELARLAALAAPTASSVKRGSARLEVIDYSTGEPITRTMAIDPALSAREALDKIFQRARRLRNGATVASTRLRDAEEAVLVLDRTIASVAIAEDAGAIDAARADAKLPSAKVAAKNPAQERKPPYRMFRTPRGEILVGRGAARNDELTFHVAKPYHLWLHVRGAPGAHVVVRLRRDQACPSDLLVDAAHLAAHFSDVRGERTVEVTYVARKFVRKPKGAPPGAVTMEREKVLALRFDSARTEHLLTMETDS